MTWKKKIVSKAGQQTQTRRVPSSLKTRDTYLYSGEDSRPAENRFWDGRRGKVGVGGSVLEGGGQREC